MSVMCGSDSQIPHLLHTAYSCGQHGPVTVWFMSARPGNVIPVPKTYVFFGGSRITLSIAVELLLLRLCFMFLQNFLLLKTELLQRKCGVLLFLDIVFEMPRKLLDLRAVCSPRPTCLLTPALEGINLYDKNSSNSSIPPSPSRDTQDNYLYAILTIFFSFRVSGPKLHLHFSFLVAYERPTSFLTIQRNEEYQ